MTRILLRGLLSIGAVLMILILIWGVVLGVFEEFLTRPAPIPPWIVITSILAVFSGIFFLSILMLKGVFVLVKHILQFSFPSWLSGIETLCISFYLVGLLVIFGILFNTEGGWIAQEGFPVVVFLGGYLFGICLLLLFNSIKEFVRIFKQD